jgi:outer membrane receptor protein involved in Fe transport
MRKMKLLGTTVLQSAAFTSAVMLAQPALAQDTPAPDQDAAAAAQAAPEAPPAQNTDCAANPNSPNCAIVVTGSRIKQPNLESTVAVTSISGQEFFETGQTSIGDTLNELPALRSTFSQANSTRFLGTGGLNLLDLRGLGTQRTLVLVNGRRHIASDILGNAVEVAVNTIPTDLVERVDVVTGGNSAIYGSDAIAGVVNFVLKQDYEGLQVRGQGGISKYGDAGNYYISALGGMNFADGRGNVALNFEYARQDDWYASQRGSASPPPAASSGRTTTITARPQVLQRHP